MTTLAPALVDPPNPTVLQALRSPRRLTREVLAGVVVALALIPEAISFSIIAGVDPRVGLFSAFIMAVTISIVGGRPAMISAATGAVALVIAPLVKAHGLDYLIATILLAGVLQLALGGLGIARLMRFVPRSVMVGFVDALAILIFLAQLPNLTGVPFAVYPLVAVGIVIIVLLPRLTRAVPAPLVSIVLVTAAVLIAGISIPTVGDQGKLPTSLPSLFIPDVPLTFDTLRIIGPYALAVAVVGILESLMTARLVDDITDSGSSKRREVLGQGIANVLSGAFGGMGGCAMIGQTMINVKISGARTRISTFVAGAFLLVLVVVLNPVMAAIPMAALTAVMIMVSVTTFDWHSIRPSTLRRMPLGETIVTAITVVMVVATGDLAIGVLVGTIVAMIVFARRVAHVSRVHRHESTDADGERRVVYEIEGELFFASSNDLASRFHPADDPDEVTVDLSASRIWDASTVAALDAVVSKYADRGKTAHLVGIDDHSSALRERVAAALGPDAH